MAILDALKPVMGEEKVYGTPAYWVKKLADKLDAEQSSLRLWDDYYSGKHRLAFATEQFRSTFGDMFRAFADNFTAIPVDSLVERLDPQGFRIPADTTDGVQDIEEITTGDSEAADIWQANHLDAESQVLHTEGLIHGKAYLLVAPGGEYPEITVESALQTACATRPGYRKDRLAAFKRWKGEGNYLEATLYLPDVLYKLRSEKPVESDLAITWQDIRWTVREVDGEQFPMRNPLGVVPVIPFLNKPRVMSEGESEIAPIIPIQDAVNKLFADLLVASEFAGMKQRVILGAEIPVDPETGEAIKLDYSKMVRDHVWHFESPDVKVDTFAESDLSNYVTAIGMAIQHIASRTRIPPHYFLASMGNFPSGEALKSAEAGLVAKTHRIQRFFGESYEETIRLALLAKGSDAKAKAAMSAETIWADAESHSEAEHMDALTKLAALGVPEELIWERAGLTPQEIERAKEIKAAAKAAEPKTPATTFVLNGSPAPADMAMQQQGTGQQSMPMNQS